MQSFDKFLVVALILLENTDPANFDRAVALYRKALSINGANDKALYSFGMALTRQPDFGVWLLAPILVPSLYASYRDLFLPAAADQ